MKHVDLEKFANGAFSAQVNRAIEEVTENIQNPNTDAGATRKIMKKIKEYLEFELSEELEKHKITVIA